MRFMHALRAFDSRHAVRFTHAKQCVVCPTLSAFMHNRNSFHARQSVCGMHDKQCASCTTDSLCHDQLALPFMHTQQWVCCPLSLTTVPFWLVCKVDPQLYGARSDSVPSLHFIKNCICCSPPINMVTIHRFIYNLVPVHLRAALLDHRHRQCAWGLQSSSIIYCFELQWICNMWPLIGRRFVTLRIIVVLPQFGEIEELVTL